MKLSSDAIQVGRIGAPSDTPSTSDAGVSNLTATITCMRESYSLNLIKSHGLLIRQSSCKLPYIHVDFHSGCIMCVAWGLLAPVGILIAMFYKVIWPNGEWFYVRYD